MNMNLSCAYVALSPSPGLGAPLSAWEKRSTGHVSLAAVMQEMKSDSMLLVLCSGNLPMSASEVKRCLSSLGIGFVGES